MLPHSQAAGVILRTGLAGIILPTGLMSLHSLSLARGFCRKWLCIYAKLGATPRFDQAVELYSFYLHYIFSDVPDRVSITYL
jgi:hypothetical protein